jgi:hypothetical protein
MGPGDELVFFTKIRQGLVLTNKVIAVFDVVSRAFMDTYTQAFSSICEKRGRHAQGIRVQLQCEHFDSLRAT